MSIIHTESGTPVHCAAAHDLLASKRACGRPQDQDDIPFLEVKLGNHPSGV